MSTSSRQPRLARPWKRILLGLGTGLLTIGLALVGMRVLAIQRRAANRVVEVGASYRLAPNLATLVSQADLVVVGNVVAVGSTQLVAQPAQQAYPAAPDPKAGALRQAAPGASSADGDHAPLLTKARLAQSPGQVVPRLAGPPARPASREAQAAAERLAHADPGVPLTHVQVQVTQVLRGTVQPGARLTLQQQGGTVQLPSYPGGPQLTRTLQFEDDPLMSVGNTEVLFLKQAADGSYYTVGGPQGRLQVQANGITPMMPNAPAMRGVSGQTLEAFAAQVRNNK